MGERTFQRPSIGLPRRSLGRFPSPIYEIPLSGRGASLFVLDEGAAGSPYGGNKVRKLEWLLPDVELRGVDDLLVSGAVGSHHVLATAIYARQLGMRCFAVLFPQPDSPHVRQNARLIDAACEGWTTVASALTLPLGIAQQMASLTFMAGRPPYLVPIGGSDALTTLGWVEAGFEIAEALADGRIPRLDRVYVAVGSGGTAAGLWVGLRLAGCDAEIVGVRVVNRAFAPESRIRRMARATLRLISAKAEAPVPAVHLDRFRLIHSWFAGGYGVADARVEAMLVQGPRLGLKLEPTYTAKSLGAALEDHRMRPLDEVAVWVNTANSQPLEGLLAEAVPDVPARMQALLIR
jgi:D-cysteine desulfhydrase